MKPLSELVKEWRARGWNPYADDLEAWLREADKEAYGLRYEGMTKSSNWIRRNLLGTTRTEGKK